MSISDEAFFESPEQQTNLERAYDLLFEQGKKTELTPFERKDFTLSEESLRQHKPKLVETIAAMANSGHPTGLILCRDSDPAAPSAERVDADEIDQAVRASVGPPPTFNIFRRVIRGRVVDVIVVPKSSMRPHVLYDKTSQRYYIPLRGAAGNATAARHAIDAIYREDELQRLRRAFPQYRVDTDDPARIFINNINYGLDPEAEANARPFYSQLIVPKPLRNRIDPSLFTNTTQNRLRLIETVNDVANGTELLPRFPNYFSIHAAHGEIFREQYIEHYAFSTHETQIAYLWGVRIYANGSIVRRSVIWKPFRLNKYIDEVAATLVFAAHAWRRYGVAGVDAAQCFSALRNVETWPLLVETQSAQCSLEPMEMEHLTILPRSTDAAVTIQASAAGKDPALVAIRLGRLLEERYSNAPRAT